MVVPTHCLYPSNSMVGVLIEGGNEEFTVSDDGRAFDEANISAPNLEAAERLVRPLDG